MTKRNDGGPAFPRSYTTALEAAQGLGESGMSLRDWFAGMALQGICANPDISTHAHKAALGTPETRRVFAEGAWAQADAMLEMKNKKEFAQ